VLDRSASTARCRRCKDVVRVAVSFFCGKNGGVERSLECACSTIEHGSYPLLPQAEVEALVGTMHARVSGVADDRCMEAECGARPVALCDFPVADGRCDKPVCDTHRVRVTRRRDHCAWHSDEARLLALSSAP